MAEVTNVVDGDTIDLNIDLGMGVHVYERCRLLGINAPEMRGKTKDAGIEARDYLAALLSGELCIHTTKDKKGKYGRYLVAVFNEMGVDVNQEMLAAGMAVPFMA